MCVRCRSRRISHTPISGLGLHTDNPYREPVPGLSGAACTHCRRTKAARACSPTASRSPSICVTRAPEAFALLTATAVPFLYRSGDAELYAERPLIQLPCSGALTAVHYNSRSIAPLPLALRETPRFYARLPALRRAAARAAVSAAHPAGRAARWWCSTISASFTAARRSPRRGTRGTCAAVISPATAFTAKRRCCAASSPQQAPHERGAGNARNLRRARLGCLFRRAGLDDRAWPAGRVLRAAAGRARALIVAALLHDIGHLLEAVPDDYRGLDERRPSRGDRRALAGAAFRRRGVRTGATARAGEALPVRHRLRLLRAG